MHANDLLVDDPADGHAIEDITSVAPNGSKGVEKQNCFHNLMLYRRLHSS